MTRAEGRRAIGRPTWGGVAGVRVVASRAAEGRVAVAGAVSAGGQGEGQLMQVEEGVRGRKVT
ncbi:hypothetical protein ACH4GK_32645 [Streptomyces rimosus]|uniref:hypothetical protein n=1 Tax=Streptomyces rimosus TaxID=1927 RepID=UPI0004C47DC9|nr:hypothetical protein [Streptomyces rimosus]